MKVKELIERLQALSQEQQEKPVTFYDDYPTPTEVTEINIGKDFAGEFIILK